MKKVKFLGLSMIFMFGALAQTQTPVTFSDLQQQVNNASISIKAMMGYLVTAVLAAAVLYALYMIFIEGGPKIKNGIVALLVGLVVFVLSKTMGLI